MSNFSLDDIDRGQFTDSMSKFCFALLHCRPELLDEGNGFFALSNDGPASIRNIEWEGAGPSTELTDEEVQTKVSELFPEET